MQNYEKFNLITSIVQNIVISISIVIGSIWALQTFLHHNPSFYETGIEMIGLEKEKISGKIELKLLDKNTSSYQVILTLKNNSKTHSQFLSNSLFSISSLHLHDKYGKNIENDLEKQSVKYNSNLIKDYNLFIPANEYREFIGFIKFEKEGIYLIETNPCMALKSNCLIQEYVFIRK